jgi:hypothetical protein
MADFGIIVIAGTVASPLDEGLCGLDSVYVGSDSSVGDAKFCLSLSLFFDRQISSTTAAMENTNATTPTPIPAFAPALNWSGPSLSKKGGPDPEANGGRPPAVTNGGGPENGGPLVCEGLVDVEKLEGRFKLLVASVLDANVGVANCDEVTMVAGLIGVATFSVGIASLTGVVGATPVSAGAGVTPGSTVVVVMPGSTVVVMPGSIVVVAPGSRVVVSDIVLKRLTLDDKLTRD